MYKNFIIFGLLTIFGTLFCASAIEVTLNTGHKTNGHGSGHGHGHGHGHGLGSGSGHPGIGGFGGWGGGDLGLNLGNHGHGAQKTGPGGHGQGGWHSGHNYEAVYNYQPLGWPPAPGKTGLLQQLFPVFVFPKHKAAGGWGWGKNIVDHVHNWFKEPKVSLWQKGQPHNVRLKKENGDYKW